MTGLIREIDSGVESLFPRCQGRSSALRDMLAGIYN